MRVYPQMSSAATWSRRIALLTLQLFVLTILLHQFAGLSTPVAMRVFGIAVLGAVIAVALALVALWRIWQDGSRGSRRALAAIFAAALVLAGPAWSLPKLFLEPGVTEVTTDATAPPAFRELAKVRADVARQVQAAAAPSPDSATTGPLTMKPLTVERSAEETFSLVRESIDELGWSIVSATPPADGQAGYIEATDRSLLFGITGDVAVRIRGGQSRARVDVRSASRYVEHDLGGNAERVSSLFQQVESAVARLEKNEEIARLARLRAERAKRIREAREAKARREKRQKQAYDTVSRQWRAPSAQRNRSRSRRSRRSQRQRTQELRQFWESMQR
ncbi:DUF1499 domain-containing protein [Dichotomicrobium thermohalophilum]|uniref:Uncharacterized protein DUF1499 n=1 Tax=Dichotomicrobium thermohalophilum TaxID=933063 RepID=A0A397PDD0_9HYPH|nr:DUF1499 domain-containing protein [Dichotomicrobium thermohalophilum]RIA47506.1 uncharacterized protein DUF1499 [Dichotomicrobium thermohalophilum]